MRRFCTTRRISAFDFRDQLQMHFHAFSYDFLNEKRCGCGDGGWGDHNADAAVPAVVGSRRLRRRAFLAPAAAVALAPVALACMFKSIKPKKKQLFFKVLYLSGDHCVSYHNISLFQSMSQQMFASTRPRPGSILILGGDAFKVNLKRYTHVEKIDGCQRERDPVWKNRLDQLHQA